MSAATEYEQLETQMAMSDKLSIRVLHEFLQSCSTVDDFELAETALQRFYASGTRPNKRTASIMIKLYCQADNPRRALQVVADPLRFGLFPGRNSMHRLMAALAQQRQHAEVLRCFEMLASDIGADATTFAFAIAAGSRSGTAASHERVIELSRTAAGHGLVLSPRTWVQVQHSHLGQGDAAGALEARELMQKQWPDVKRLSAMQRQMLTTVAARALAVKGDLGGAVHQFEQLVELPKVKVLPIKTTQFLWQAVQDSGDAGLAKRFDTCLDAFRSAGTHVPPLEATENTEDMAIAQDQEQEAAEPDSDRQSDKQ